MERNAPIGRSWRKRAGLCSYWAFMEKEGGTFRNIGLAESEIYRGINPRILRQNTLLWLFVVICRVRSLTQGEHTAHRNEENGSGAALDRDNATLQDHLSPLR